MEEEFSLHAADEVNRGLAPIGFRKTVLCI